MRNPKNKYLAYNDEILASHINWNDREKLIQAAIATIDNDYDKRDEFIRLSQHATVKELRKFFTNIGFTFEKL